MSSPVFKTIILCLFIALSMCTDSDEFFSSMDSLHKLGNLELNLAASLQEYLEMQTETIAKYRKFLQNVKHQHALAEEDIGEYVGNPINAFTLINRMVTSWTVIHEMVKANVAREVLRNSLDEIEEEFGLPNSNDLTGAVYGFVRLQNIYNLSSFDLADGVINGRFHGTYLDWRDCFEIARNIFEDKKYSLAISWFKTTLEVMLDDDDASDEKDLSRKMAFELDAFEYLALSHYKLGDVVTALKYLDEILIQYPKDTAQETRDYMLLSKRKVSSLDSTTPQIWGSNYTRLCQGIRLSETVSTEFKCKIDTKGNPYFTLAPLKMEIVNIDPQITVYHGLLNEDQIETILDEAENDMTRSTVSIAAQTSNERVSQQAWLNYTSPITQMVKRLVTQVSGLDLENAETLQVANYGIGGQYDPHHDFFPMNTLPFGFEGNRISTNMIYLSNVEEGGYTVFPKLDIYLRPVQGSMIEWYNLHKSLDCDFRTLHAGCPVLSGSKRIGNIWIHSGLQEFRRPCDLVSDTHKSLAYV